MIGDLRSAFTQFRRRPAYAAGAALSLAIGTALATSVFAVVTSVVRRPLPFAAPEALVQVVETSGPFTKAGVSRDLIVSLRDSAHTIAQVAAYRHARLTIGQSGSARTVGAAVVSSRFFELLGVRPLLGSTFDSDDGLTGRAAIIDYAFWMSEFGGKADVLGQTVRVNNTPYVVRGVMPDRFRHPAEARVWLPLDDAALGNGGSSGDPDVAPYRVVARLRRDATIEAARAEVGLTHRRLRGGSDRILTSALVIPLSEYLTADIRNQLRLWAAAAVIIAMLCALNFATVSLARGMERKDDLALRAALGASKGRLVRTLLAETLMLAAVGGATAILLSAGLNRFAHIWFANSALAGTLQVDWLTVGFGMGLTLVLGFVFGLAPAFELATIDLREVLQTSTGGSRRRSLRGHKALVALQLCLGVACVAVVVALVQADKRNMQLDGGVDYQRLITANVVADGGVRTIDVTTLTEEVRRKPWVSDVVLVLPGERTAVWQDNNAPHDAYVRDVSASYFTTIGLAPRAGRLPTAEEIRGSDAVAVLEESAALRLFQSLPAALGQQVSLKRAGEPRRLVRIIGVISDVSVVALPGVGATIFTFGRRTEARSGVLIVRAQTAPQIHLTEIAATAAGTVGRALISDIRTAQSRIESSRAASRGRTIFLVCVGSLAMLLAVVGTYGLTSYTTQLRVRELGIRIAMGATPVNLARLLFSDLWWMGVVGIGIAIVVSARVVTFLDALFRNPFQRTPLITLSLGPTLAAGAALFIILVLGTWVPLRRVLRLQVMRAMQGASVRQDS